MVIPLPLVASSPKLVMSTSSFVWFHGINGLGDSDITIDTLDPTNGSGNITTISDQPDHAVPKDQTTSILVLAPTSLLGIEEPCWLVISKPILPLSPKDFKGSWAAR